MPGLEPSQSHAAAVVYDAPVAAIDKPSLFELYMELGKARLSAMVVITTALGFAVADRANPSPNGFDWMKLFWTCLGTMLAAMGASAFNQVLEVRRDKLMNRTQGRPIPAGHISKMHAAYFALLCCIAGVAILCPTSNGLTAELAAANIIIYVLIYTPLKPVSTINTLVGAVVGGIPPMLGWAAVTDNLPAGAWVLGAFLFVWQIPHFLALAWMYKDDYARGGYKMISVTDKTGRMTALFAIVYSFALLPICLLLVHLGHAGLFFGIFSTILSLGLCALALRFGYTRTRADARRLFFGSIIYLPLLSGILVCDAGGPYARYFHAEKGYVNPADVAPLNG